MTQFLGLTKRNKLNEQTVSISNLEADTYRALFHAMSESFDSMTSIKQQDFSRVQNGGERDLNDS
jgi:hypothetical protein